MIYRYRLIPKLTKGGRYTYLYDLVDLWDNHKVIEKDLPRSIAVVRCDQENIKFNKSLPRATAPPI